jgi:hypothetical protein
VGIGGIVIDKVGIGGIVIDKVGIGGIVIDKVGVSIPMECGYSGPSFGSVDFGAMGTDTMLATVYCTIRRAWD